MDNNSTSPSKRWKTTLTSQNENITNSTANDISEITERKSRLKNIKLNSTKGNISFGNENVKYISDAHDNQLKILKNLNTLNLDPNRRVEELNKIKDMKANLTTTNFILGTEKVDYASTNQDAMKTVVDPNKSSNSKMIETMENKKLLKNLKEQIKKSSLYFGNEKVNYSSINNEEYKNLFHGDQEHKKNNGEAEEESYFEQYNKKKLEIKDMKAKLRKHNFTLGEEKIDYTSDYQSGFGSVPSNKFKIDKSKLKEQIEDIRKCHFTLGHDRVEYVSDAQRAGTNILNHKTGTLNY